MEKKRPADNKAQTTPSYKPSLDEHLTASCRHYFDENIVFKPASRPDSYLQRLNSNYRPLNPTMPELNQPSRSPGGEGSTPSSSSVADSESPKDGIPPPKRVIYDPEQLEMKWKGPRTVGAGLANMGNTCFLNSVLQCLTYTPPLFNYLSTESHRKTCKGQGFCAMCELQKHAQKVTNQSGGVVKPINIVHNLRVIGKHFRQGRQEDAHEFLRYFVDGLQRSSLQSVPSGLDPHSKATTVVHQIFGGYHCSQVRCSECHKTSETFDPLLDLSLDIKGCTSLKQTLSRFTKPDSLEGENQYACPLCKRMTSATKVFTLHRLPNILTIQLKRFDYNSLFGGKLNKHVPYPIDLDMRPYTTSKKGPPQWYQLYAVLVHSGYSCRSGHYYCYVRGSNKTWYCLNDAQVTQVSIQQVLRQEAYLLFYSRNPEHETPPTLATPPPASAALTQKAPDTPTATPTTPQPKVRPDPNFLREPMKRPSPHLDKNGTPLVRLKPTGIVPPSPQEPSPSASSSSSSSASNSTHSQPHPPTLPLRKSDVDHTPKTLLPPTSAAEPLKPVATQVKKPSFIPRVISAPSSSASLQQKRRKSQQQQQQQQLTAAMKNEKGIAMTREMEDQQGEVKREEGGRESETHPLADGRKETSEGGGGGDRGVVGERSEVFIGPRLPESLSTSGTPSSTSTSTSISSPSLKIARVQPQIKPAKPVALVHPVVPDNVSPNKSVVKIVKGLAGDSMNSRNYYSPKPGWRPVGMTPADPSPPPPRPPEVTTPQTDPEPKHQDEERPSQKVPRRSLSPEVTKKRKKHKKKKSHRTEEEKMEHQRERKAEEQRERKAEEQRERKAEEQRERKAEEQRERKAEEQRERKHSRSSAEERGRKRVIVDYSSDGDSEFDDAAEEEIPKKKKKKRSQQHSTHRDSKRYSSSSAHSRSRHSPSSYTDSSDNSLSVEEEEEDSDDVERETRGGRSQKQRSSRRDERRERKYSSGHRERDSTQSKKDSERRKRYSSGASKYHHSPSPPDRRERKRNRSNLEEDEKQHGSSGNRHKSSKQDSSSSLHHHKKKKHHTTTSSSSSHHHHHHHKHSHHHDRIKPSKHINTEPKHSSSSSHHGEIRSSTSSDTRSHTHHENKSHAHKSHEAAVGGGHHLEKTGGGRKVPEVAWDHSIRGEGRKGGGQGTSPGSQWDGSRGDDVIGMLTSQTSNQLGAKVRSWDGGNNTIDVSAAAASGDRKRRDNRDDWDRELDRGKVKKVKNKKEEDFPAKNPFQEFQNKKNSSKGNNNNNHTSS